MSVQPSTSATASRANATEPDPREFPVREYIGAMATELAEMARWDGDEALGRLLDSAAALAAEPHQPQISSVTKEEGPVRKRA